MSTTPNGQQANSTTKHTPGPWSTAWCRGALRHINKNVPEYLFYSADGDPQAGANTPNIRINSEDGDLFAAAPDLLAACKAVLADCAPAGDTGVLPPHTDTLTLVLNAIRKAGGAS